MFDAPAEGGKRIGECEKVWKKNANCYNCEILMIGKVFQVE